jgi:integrase
MSARPFTEPEYLTLVSHLTAAGRTRDTLLVVLGCATGYRIQELLSVTVGQVWDGQDVTQEITVARRDLKGGRGIHKKGIRGRRVPLSETVRDAIRDHLAVIGTADPQRALFATNRSEGGAMHRSRAYCLLVEACEECGIDTTRISNHTYRKTFVGRIYSASGHDLIRTQRIVQHASPVTTARYIETDAGEMDNLIRNLAIAPRPFVPLQPLFAAA